MKIIVLALIAWIISAVIRADRDIKRRGKQAMFEIRQGMSQRENRAYLERLAEAERQQTVQRRNDWLKARTEAQEWVQRQLAIEREQLRLAKVQQEQAKEQERLAKEQARQAEVLRRHEQRIADLEFRMQQAERDIEHWTQQIGNLYALLDIEQERQAASVPGSKADIQHQKRIITLSNQIHTAESRLAKAKHIKVTAQKQLAA